MKAPSIEFEILNFKSYFGDSCKVKIEKPITLIVGPNGEGKTNLLQAMLIILDEFTQRYPTIRDRSLFTQKVQLARKPTLAATSLRDSIIYEAQSVGEKEWSHGYREVFAPEAIVSYGYDSCTISLSIHRPRIERKGEVNLAQYVVSFSGSPIKRSFGKCKRNISHLDLVYISPESPSLDVFAKLVGQEFSRLIRGKRGQESKHRFFMEIMSSFPSDEKRLVRDLAEGRFREIYSDNSLYLTSGLATGVKKELILYSLGLIMERNKKVDDWLAVLLIDELGQGLHLSRQAELANALASFLEKKDVKDHIRLIATTHSPLIYSEIVRLSDLSDIYFVLREKGHSSKVAKWGEGDDKMIEKMLTTKLWLNMFSLPEKLVFVEGKTDKLFFDRALRQIANTEIFKLMGTSIPNVLLDLLKKLPLARQRKYIAIGDERGIETLRRGAKELEEAGGHLEVIGIGSNSLEEFILGIPKKHQGKRLWDLLAIGFENLEKKARNMGLELPHIDVAEARIRLETDGREGVNSFLNSLKNKSQIYETTGEHWTELLPENSRSQVESIIERIEQVGSQLPVEVKH